METNVNYTIVGAFVILLTAALILGIVWLSAGVSLEPRSIYEADMTESVAGLSIDSPVEFNGVNVGTVMAIDLDQKNPRQVRVLLKIKTSTPISQGTHAMLSSRGLTGITYLALKDTGSDLTPLVAEPGQTYPIIKTLPSFYLRLERSFDEMRKELHQVSDSITMVLDPDNLLAIKRSLKNIRSITDTLAQNGQQLNNILQNTAKASQDFVPLMQDSASTMQQLGDATSNINAITTEIKQNPALLIRGRAQPLLGPGEK